MRARALWVMLAVGAAACATAPKATGPASDAASALAETQGRPLPAPPQIIRTHRTVLGVGDLAYARLRARGFLDSRPIRTDGSGTPGSAVALASARRETGGEHQSCVGVTEVLQVTATDAGATTQARLSCYTERLALDEGGRCTMALEPGCAAGGDRTLGEIALELMRR